MKTSTLSTFQCRASNLAVPRSWECKRRREPYWVWLVDNWLTAEDSHLMPPVSEVESVICYCSDRNNQTHSMVNVC